MQHPAKQQNTSFIEHRFPIDISYNATGGPAFSTNVFTTHAGQERRRSNWSSSLARYNVAHGVKTEAQAHELISFFRICMGRAIGFRFKDWMDYKVQKQQIAIGDGKQKTFPLYARYGIDKETFALRRIYKPVAGTISLILDHRKLISSEYEIDYTNGLVHFDDPPYEDEPLFASFEFDVPVRFDTDHLDASIDGFGVYSWNNIPLIELRPPVAPNKPAPQAKEA